MAPVTLKKLVKRYGNVDVVHGIDLEVKDREFIALVGPSGCGKSTTLRMIAGLEDISDGVIEIGGKPVNDLPPRARNISMVFQSYALYPHMTVRENMGFSLKIGKVQQAEIDSACELIDFWRWNVHCARRVIAEQPVSSPGVWNRFDHRPLEGFVLAITPFNFTAIAGNLPTAPALMGTSGKIWR
ncbi:MAG: aldehyde dehydrogenase family protein, partial [Phyllobacterium sp.]|nr:aldehyde dehydrogenase family protein [Phyllobacterium sp.]